MITSENDDNFWECSPWGTILDIFYFMKNQVLFLRYSIFYIITHSINLKRCDAMMSISTTGKVQIVNHLVMKLGQIIDIVMGNISRLYCLWFGGLGSWSL